MISTTIYPTCGFHLSGATNENQADDEENQEHYAQQVHDERDSEGSRNFQHSEVLTGWLTSFEVLFKWTNVAKLGNFVDFSHGFTCGSRAAQEISDAEIQILLHFIILNVRWFRNFLATN